MRLNIKRKKSNQYNKNENSVITCKTLNRPVYDHEICSNSY